MGGPLPGYAGRVSSRAGQPDLRFRFERTPSAAREARRALRTLFDDPADPVLDDIALTASELVANVVQHTHGGGEMRVWDAGGDVPVRLEVEDPEGGVVIAARQLPDARSGRGLNIIRQVADDWGVVQTNLGKVVWAEFDRAMRRERSNC